MSGAPARVRLDLTWPQVLAWRARRQFLEDEDVAADPVAVARRAVGVHAQVMSSAEAAVRVRAPSVGADDVRRALEVDRTLVKTWSVRGTLHLVAADELPSSCAALWWLRGERYRSSSHALFDAMASALSAAGRCLTRDELAAAVAEATGRPELGANVRSSWGSYLKPIAHRGRLCFGAPQGRNVTFVDPRVWLGPAGWVDDGVGALSAAVDLVRRYLRVYGPASMGDVALWLGATQRDLRVVMDAVAGELAAVAVDGQPAMLLEEDVESMAATPRRGGSSTVRLLAAFDPLVVGSLKQLPAMLGGDRAAWSLVSRTSGWISPVVTVGGRIVAVWRAGDPAQVRVLPGMTLSRTVRRQLPVDCVVQ